MKQQELTVSKVEVAKWEKPIVVKPDREGYGRYYMNVEPYVGQVLGDDINSLSETYCKRCGRDMLQHGFLILDGGEIICPGTYMMRNGLKVVNITPKVYEFLFKKEIVQERKEDTTTEEEGQLNLFNI